MLFRAIFLVGTLLAGCTTPPAEAGVEAECKTDADCTTTVINQKTCCDQCRPEAISRATDDANRKRCAAQTTHDKCPVLDCPNYGRQAAVCKAHKCELQKAHDE
jgi:hypothetical protein